MFYRGDLQAGINEAVQSSKQVACFVCDDESLSRLWEETLESAEWSDKLNQLAVFLRIQANSVEASFLSAFVTTDQIPVFVVIGTGSRTGQVEKILQIDKESTTQTFDRLHNILQSNSTQSNPTSTEDDVTSVTIPEPSSLLDSRNSPELLDTSSPLVSTPNPTNESPKHTKAATEQESWAAKQRRINQEKRQERERIMAQIEADKEARRQARKHLNAKANPSSSSTSSVPSTPTVITKPSGPTAAINIRLLDGKTLRSSFASTTTASELGKWIDEHLQSISINLPHYKLKHLPGPPLPARDIDIVDEPNKTLAELGFSPSATLIIVPSKITLSNGYLGNGIVVMISTFITWLIGLFLYPFTSNSQSSSSSSTSSQSSSKNNPNDEKSKQDETGETNVEATTNSTDPSKNTARLRTITQMRDEQDKESRLLYNGNQLNFEDDNEDK